MSFLTAAVAVAVNALTTGLFGNLFTNSKF